MKYIGHYFDGINARAQPVKIELADNGVSLCLDVEQQPFATWDIVGLYANCMDADSTTLRHKQWGNARLQCDDPELQKQLRRLNSGLFRLHSPANLAKKITLTVTVLTAAVLFIYFVIIPGASDYIAYNISPEIEQKIGKDVRDLVTEYYAYGSTSCSTPAADAALAQMIETLAAQAHQPLQLQLEVLDIDEVNALALPGGIIIIFRGLLEFTTTAEQLAGVLAHEIGHVAHKDPLRLAARAGASGGILAIVLGDFTGLIAGMVIESSYSRDAEATADEYAYHLLAKAGISSRHMVQFWETVIAKEHPSLRDNQVLNILSSHPAPKERLQMARDMQQLHITEEQILTPLQWQQLQDICKQDDIQ